MRPVAPTVLCGHFYLFPTLTGWANVLTRLRRSPKRCYVSTVTLFLIGLHFCWNCSMAKDRKLQLPSDPLIFGYRHLHQQGESNRIKRRDDRFQLLARHGGAADSSLPGSAPDVQED